MTLKRALLARWRGAHWSVRLSLGGIGAGLVAGAAVYNYLADYWPPLIAIGLAVVTLACVALARILRRPARTGDAP